MRFPFYRWLEGNEALDQSKAGEARLAAREVIWTGRIIGAKMRAKRRAKARKSA